MIITIKVPHCIIRTIRTASKYTQLSSVFLATTASSNHAGILMTCGTSRVSEIFKIWGRAVTKVKTPPRTTVLVGEGISMDETLRRIMDKMVEQ